MKCKVKILMVALILLLSACAKVVPGNVADNDHTTWQEQYDLGVRYLSEGNYERAIIAFTAAIEIDPKTPEAYIGLADAYMGNGESVKAAEVLNTALGGLADEGDLAVIREKLSTITEDEPETETEMQSPDDKEETPDYTRYAIPIEAAIASRDAGFIHGSGEGILFDVDGNGTDELILVYEAMVDTDYGQTPCMVCSAYTIKDNTVISLIDRQVLYVEAGGPSGWAEVATLDGETFLAVFGSNGEYPVLWEGTWSLYRINGDEISLDTVAEYSRFYLSDTDYDDYEPAIDYSESSANINGNEVSYSDYEMWESGIGEVKILDGYNYDDDNSDNGVPLEDLLALLEPVGTNK